jgi:hypothetical protein
MLEDVAILGPDGRPGSSTGCVLLVAQLVEQRETLGETLLIGVHHTEAITQRV